MSEAEYIHAEFQVDVNLRFQPTTFNPWPTVIETRSRLQEIMKAWNIRQIADLHCYPGDSKECMLPGDWNLHGEENRDYLLS